MANRIPKIVVVGSSYVDMTMRCSLFPSAGQSICGSALSYTPTGPGPNQAFEASRCGCQTHLISKIGSDPFGQMIKSALAEEKVKTDFIYTAEAKNTGVFMTLVNTEGENASCRYIGANSALLAVDIENSEQHIDKSDVWLIHGNLPQEAITAAIKCAKLQGAKIILNPARPIQSQSEETRNGTDLPDDYFCADILIPNLDEAADITDVEPGAANIRTAKLIGSDLVARGAASAVITMGRRGCMVVDRNGADHVPAFEVELIDQAGSGDAFAGALAAYYAVQEDIRAAVKFACAAGALACSKFGAFEAMPKKAEIIELLQKEDTE